jgi:hypothetical protein
MQLSSRGEDDGTYAVAQSYVTSFDCWCSSSFSGPALKIANTAHGKQTAARRWAMSCYVEAKE